MLTSHTWQSKSNANISFSFVTMPWNCMKKRIWRDGRRRGRLAKSSDVMNGGVFPGEAVQLTVPKFSGRTNHYIIKGITSTKILQDRGESMPFMVHVVLYCCYCNVGRAATNNDINLLIRSQLLRDIVSRRFSFCLPRTHCVLPNGKVQTMSYLLADIIYPS